MHAAEGISASAGRAMTALAALAFALVVAGCAESGKAPASASAADNPVDDSRLRGYFATMDQDGDGFISRPEFEGERGAVFLAIDKNNSVTLTADEMHLSPEAFAKLAGGDDVVTPAEFNNAEIASFEAIDSNHDLQLSYDELRAFVQHFGSQ